MKFSFGEVLSRAWQITWKHKNLWLAGILVGLMSFIPTLVSFLFNPSVASFTDPSDVNRALPSILLTNAVVILMSIALIPVFVMGMAVPSLGTIRVEEGSEKLNFGELIKDVLPYFWRVLGIFLLVWVGAVLVVMAFLACIFIFSMFTMGIGALCAIPLIILFIPFAVLVYGMTEQGVSAILADNLRFSDALQRAWELLRKNLVIIALMSIIVYLGSIAVSMVISVPMMIPMFEFILNMGAEPDMQSVERLSRNMILWTLAFSPIYAVFQGIILTFMQSAWTLTYLRLTRSPKLQALPETAQATT